MDEQGAHTLERILNCARDIAQGRRNQCRYARECLRPKSERNAIAVPQQRRPENRATSLALEVSSSGRANQGSRN
jgi:hypothetical protein